MKAHTKLYLFHFGYSESYFIPCETCGKKAVDIHHIEARGMGGSKLKDTINNLMALCRTCHEDFGDKKQHKKMLIQVHQEKLKQLARANGGRI